MAWQPASQLWPHTTATTSNQMIHGTEERDDAEVVAGFLDNSESGRD
jgi:hypothetical protein